MKMYEDEKRGKDEVKKINKTVVPQEIEVPHNIVDGCLNDEAIPNSMLVPLLKLIKNEELENEAREKVDAVIKRISRTLSEKATAQENEVKNLSMMVESDEKIKTQKFLRR